MDRFNRHMGRFALNLAMVLFSLLALFPLCWVALTAFQPTDQGVSFVLADILAKKPTLQNFVRVSELIPMAQNFWNSVVVSVVGTLLTLFFCALAGYAFAKFRFPGRDALFLLLLLTMVIPPEVCIVPLFVVMRRLGWINSMLSLIIPRAATAVGIFYMRQYIGQYPTEILEQARIDGCREFGIFWRVVVPGITPALGANVVEICKEACKAAKAHGVKISCDLNYRGKLWTRDEARAAMTELCQYVDVCISNEEDAKDVFGIEAENTDITGGELNKEGYKSVAKQLADKFNFEMVAITLRESKSAFDNDWSAMLYNVAKDEYCFSKLYHLHIIDRIGGGDSFGGGLIYALLSGKDTQAAVEFAVAASALKHSIEGDYNFVTVPEVEKLAGGDGSGRVQR